MERPVAFHRGVAPVIGESVLLGFFPLILFQATALVPIVGPAISLFAPLPLIFFWLRRDLLAGTLGLLSLSAVGSVLLFPWGDFACIEIWRHLPIVGRGHSKGLNESLMPPACWETSTGKEGPGSHEDHIVERCIQVRESWRLC